MVLGIGGVALIYSISKSAKILDCRSDNHRCYPGIIVAVVITAAMFSNFFKKNSRFYFFKPTAINNENEKLLATSKTLSNFIHPNITYIGKETLITII